jgi:ribonuclease P protein component
MVTRTFKKSERLSGKKSIKELFEKGSSFYLYPFKVVFLGNSQVECSQHRVLVSVSKRNFKKAPQRNLLKRRIKEAYRLNKAQLVTSEKLLIAYIYTSKETLSFKEIEKRLLLTFSKLQDFEIGRVEGDSTKS